MKTLFLGIVMAAVILTVCPSVPAALSAFAAHAIENAQATVPWGSNAALERMIADEQKRLATIRAQFGRWKAVETCRADIAEFERFAAATHTPYQPQMCS